MRTEVREVVETVMKWLCDQRALNLFLHLPPPPPPHPYLFISLVAKLTMLRFTVSHSLRYMPYYLLFFFFLGGGRSSFFSQRLRTLFTKHRLLTEIVIRDFSMIQCNYESRSISYTRGSIISHAKVPVKCRVTEQNQRSLLTRIREIACCYLVLYLSHKRSLFELCSSVCV